MCCSLLTASLNKSRSGKLATASGKAFHCTMTSAFHCTMAIVLSLLFKGCIYHVVTCPCNVDLLPAHFIYCKIGGYRGIHYFLTFALKHRLWAVFRTPQSPKLMSWTKMRNKNKLKAVIVSNVKFVVYCISMFTFHIKFVLSISGVGE